MGGHVAGLDRDDKSVDGRFGEHESMEQKRARLEEEGSSKGLLALIGTTGAVGTGDVVADLLTDSNGAFGGDVQAGFRNSNTRGLSGPSDGPVPMEESVVAFKAPEIFRLDSNGDLEVILEAPPEALHAKLAAAVRFCPTKALATEEDGSG